MPTKFQFDYNCFGLVPDDLDECSENSDTASMLVDFMCVGRTTDLSPFAAVALEIWDDRAMQVGLDVFAFGRRRGKL